MLNFSVHRAEGEKQDKLTAMNSIFFNFPIFKYQFQLLCLLSIWKNCIKFLLIIHADQDSLYVPVCHRRKQMQVTKKKERQTTNNKQQTTVYSISRH